MGPYPINLCYLQQNNIHYYVKSFIYTIYRYKYIYILHINRNKIFSTRRRHKMVGFGFTFLPPKESRIQEYQQRELISICALNHVTLISTKVSCSLNYSSWTRTSHRQDHHRCRIQKTFPLCALFHPSRTKLSYFRLVLDSSPSFAVASR